MSSSLRPVSAIRLLLALLLAAIAGRAEAVSANDNWANAITINANGQVDVAGDTVGATLETGEPRYPYPAGGSGAAKTIWYKWTPSANGRYAISTKGSNFDTIIGVFTGTAVNALSHIVSNDEYYINGLPYGDAVPGGRTSRLLFDAVAGTTYSIQIDGWNTASGTVKLHIQPAPVLTLAATTAGFESATPTNGVFTVSIANPNRDVFPIFFTTSDLTTTAGSDYTVATASPIVLPADATSAAIDITVLDDLIGEGNEQLRAALAAQADTYSLGATTTADLTIVDGEATRIYVDPDATGLGNGTSWSDAITEFATAVALSAAGNEIWVRHGTYRPTSTPTRGIPFRMKSGVAWYGGFAGWETSLDQRDWRTRPTILSGDIGTVGNASDNSYAVVKGATGGTIDGFIIRDGRADDPAEEENRIGGGISCPRGAAPVVRNCVFSANNAVVGGGAGIYSFGLTLAAPDGAPTFENCVFTGNSASNGGGVFANLTGNSALFRMTGCVVSGNSASTGGGLYIFGTNAQVQSCTVAGNTASTSPGGAYLNGSSRPIALSQTIVWGNTSPAPAGVSVIGTVTAAYSCFQSVFSGTGNIVADPLFTAAGDPDGVDNIWMTSDDGLTLRPGSPCVNTGNPAATPTADLTGMLRPLAASFGLATKVTDMGAYERAPIIYVNAAATAPGDGRNWGTAYTSLASALSAAAQNENEVWVAAGTYVPGGARTDSFRLVAGVPVFGGFAGGEANASLRDPAVNRVTLSGQIGDPGDAEDNSYNVVYGARRATLDGFIIRDGYADVTAMNPYGGGMMDQFGGTLIGNCVFRDNYAIYWGGALFSYPDSNTTLRNCLFFGNVCDNYGGAVASYASSVYMVHCTMEGNRAPLGGAFTPAYGPGTVRNCILYGNQVPQIFRFGGVERVGVSGSDVEGSGGSAGWLTAFGIDRGGNIDADPQWVNVGSEPGGDGMVPSTDDGLRLGTGSPCVNTGVAANDLPARDLLTVSRPVGGVPDMGCYEGRVGIVAFSAASGSGSENGAAPVITVTLAAASDLPITVSCGISGGTATAADRSLSTTLITFLPGDTSETVALNITSDQVQESDETVVLTLSSPVNARLGTTQSYTWTIRNDDTAGIVTTPNKSTGLLVTSEAGTTATFTVQLTSEPATGSVDITYESGNQFEGLLSKNGILYGASVVLTFTTANWSTPQTVTVRGQDDDVADSAVTYSVKNVAIAAADPAYAALTAAEVEVRNSNNDVVGIQTDVTSVATTEAAGLDKTKTIQVRLRSQPTSSVTVPISVSNAKATVSPASVTFTATKDQAVSGTTSGWNVWQSVTVTGADDDTDDSPIVEAAYNVTFGGATSSDGAYAGQSRVVPGTNTDDDVAGLIVSPTTPPRLITTEAGGQASFTVRLRSQPLATVTVPLAVVGTEGTLSTSSLTFTTSKNVAGGWNVAQTVTVTGADERIDDGDQDYQVTVGTTSATGDGLYNGAFSSSVLCSNEDNDVAGISFTPSGGLITTELGGSATTQVQLTSKPTNTVTYMIASNDTTEGRVDAGGGPAASVSLTFTPLNWDSPQPLTLVGQADDGDIVDQNYTLSATVDTVLTLDPVYDALTPVNPAVTAKNRDLLQPAVIILPEKATVTEALAGRTTTLAVRLNTRPTVGTVTITFTSDNTDLATVSPAQMVFTNVDGAAFDGTSSGWNVAQTMTITGKDDAVDQADRTFHINAVSSSAGVDPYNGIAIDPVDGLLVDDDVRSITVVPSGTLATTEPGGVAAFSVVLASRPSAGSVTVPVRSTLPSEGLVRIGSTTGSEVSLVFGQDDWNIPRTVTVIGQNDLEADGDRSYQIVFSTVAAPAATIANPGGDYDGMAQPTPIEVFNQDNDTAGIIVSRTTIALDESDPDDIGTGVAYTVRLRSRPTQNVTVTLAQADQQISLSTTTLTFTDQTGVAGGWDQERTVTVKVLPDPVAEGAHGDQIFHSVASADPVYDRLSAPTIAVSVADDPADAPGLVLLEDDGVTLLDPPEVTITEASAGRTNVFKVRLGTQPRQPVTVLLASDDLSEGTATARLVFTSLDWNTPQEVLVTGVDDTLDDDDKTFDLGFTTISADVLYNGLGVTPVEITTVDDDTAGVSFTAVTGTTSESGGQTTFTVVLDSQPAGEVRIDVASLSTEGEVDPEELVFTPANWNSAQVVTVTGLPDDVDDGNSTFQVEIGPASSADDADYDLIAQWTNLTTVDITTGTSASLQVTNVDIDTAGVLISPTSGLLVGESGAADIYTVVLRSKPSDDVVVTPSVDGQLSPLPPLTFTAANWDVAQTVTVGAIDDAIAEGVAGVPHTGTITHVVTSGDPLAAPPTGDPLYRFNASAVTVLVTDNDTPGVEIAPATGLTVAESGTTAFFSVRLTSQPTADVTFTITSQTPGKAKLSTLLATTPDVAVTLTFTAADWDDPQQVTITGQGNRIDDGDTIVVLQTSAITSGDARYAGSNPIDVTVTCQDDDVAGVTIDESAYEGHAVAPATDLSEFTPATTWSYSVVLDSEPTAAVTLTFATNGQVTVDADDALAGTQNSVVFEPDDTSGQIWDRARRITLTVVDDVNAEGGAHDGTITATAVGGGYNGVVIAPVTVTISDDEQSTPPVVDLHGPQPNGPGVALAYTEGIDGQTPSVPLDANATVVDADSPDFDGGSLRVSITNGIPGEDILGIQDGGAGDLIHLSGMSITYGAGGGPQVTIGTFGVAGTELTVTFTTASKPAVEALLKSILYANASDTPSTTTRTIEVELNDGDGGVNSPLATKEVQITASNDRPTATAATYFTVSGHDLAGTLAGTDPEGTALRFAIVGGHPAATDTFRGGTIAVDPVTGGFTYSPPSPSFSGDDHFEFTVVDTAGTGLAAAVQATAQIIVTGGDLSRPQLAQGPVQEVEAGQNDIAIVIDPASVAAGGQPLQYQLLDVPSGVSAIVTPDPAPGQPHRARIRVDVTAGAPGAVPGNLGDHAFFGVLVIDPNRPAAMYCPLTVQLIAPGGAG